MSSTIDTYLRSSDSNGELAGQNQGLISSQIASQSFWRKGAPKKIFSGDLWENWSRHLAERKTPESVNCICRAEGTALVWAINFAELPTATFELLQLAAQPHGNKSIQAAPFADAFTEWLAGADSFLQQKVEFALECLAVAHLLPDAAGAIQEDVWWGLLDILNQFISQTENWQIDEEVEPAEALAHQLLCGELPLTLAYLFPEIRPLYKLQTAAQDCVAEGLSELLNGAGLPHARYVPIFRALLASWTRCHAMSGALEKPLGGARAEEQYRLAVTKAIELSSTTGHNLLSGAEAAPWSLDFLSAALREGGDSADRTAALDFFQKELSKNLPRKAVDQVPETSESSEWSELAILRTDWIRRSAVVAIDYSRPEMKLDLWSGRRRLIYGDWLCKSKVDGQPLAVTGRWEETCWFTDPDVDYIELSIDLERGARLERQILLARKDNFLLLVDNLMNLPGGVAYHEYLLPVCPDVRFHPEVESREGLLIADEPVSRLLPIAQPEWRIDPRVGNLAVLGNHLQVTHERPGRNLSCPLFFDLDSKRFKKECTWRQLTVAQSLEIQPPEVAVGYRVQCGKAQWLIYRSMEAPANRTVLGYNLSIEGMVGRFSAPGGEVEELLQIEG